jgi:hypothetical protein
MSRKAKSPQPLQAKPNPTQSGRDRLLQRLAMQIAEGIEGAQGEAGETDSSSKTAMAAYVSALAALRATHQTFSRAAL